MRRYELWVDNDKKLALSEFRSLGSERESRILRGSETYNTIKALSLEPIINIKEKDNYCSIEFENYIININEIDYVLEKRGITPLVNKIQKYYETQVLKQIKKKKVTRKNKHTGKKILAIGAGLLIIAGTAIVVSSNVEAIGKFNITKEDVVISDVEEISEINNLENVKEISNVTTSSTYKTNISPLKNNIKSVSIDYGDRSDTDKAYKTKAYYGDMIEKYATRYGVDPNLAIAIATQERGIHGTTIDDGGAIGLMQIQYGVWADEFISAYNFETGKRESFVVDGERLADIDYNIKVGCMYLQNCMEYMNYNPVAAVQCYNMGDGSMRKILKAYSSECGKTVKEILNDPLDTGWLDYRYVPGIGDPDYVENVFSYLGEDLNIKNIKKDGTVVNTNINNQVSSKKIY